LELKMPNLFWQYELIDAGEAVCLGERVKKGTYRGTIDSCIPFSQITGALTDHFTKPFYAVGVMHESPRIEQFSFALQDVVRGVAKLTLDVSALSRVRASVFIWRDPRAAENDLPEQFHLRIGALRSKGFGLCRLQNKRAVQPENHAIAAGVLRTRIPEFYLPRFDVEPLRPLYCYLFEPDQSRTSGRYVRSLMEGSLVRGPRFLIDERSL
jgi:hypothetical protein